MSTNKRFAILDDGSRAEFMYHLETGWGRFRDLDNGGAWDWPLDRVTWVTEALHRAES